MIYLIEALKILELSNRIKSLVCSFVSIFLEFTCKFLGRRFELLSSSIFIKLTFINFLENTEMNIIILISDFSKLFQKRCFWE